MATGAVRKIDVLGRVVIPAEIRKSMRMDTDDSVEIYVEDNIVKVKKFIPSMTCMVTGENSEKNIQLANGKIVVSPSVARQIAEELQQKIG